MIRFDKHVNYPKWLWFPRFSTYPGFAILGLSWLRWSVVYIKTVEE